MCWACKKDLPFSHGITFWCLFEELVSYMYGIKIKVFSPLLSSVI